MATSYLDPTALDAYLNAPKVTSARGTASAAGSINSASGHFTGTGTSTPEGLLDRIKSMFKGSPSVTRTTDDLGKTLAEMTLHETQREAAVTNGLPTNIIDENIAKTKAKLTAHAEELFPQMHAAKIEHLNAQQALGHAQLDALADAKGKFMAEFGAAADEAGRQTARENLTATEAAIKAHFEPAMTEHAEFLKGTGEIEKQIEKHTGVKAAEHTVSAGKKAVASAAVSAEKAVLPNVEKGIIGEAEYGGKNFVMKKVAEINANWKQTKGFRKAGVAVGSLVGVGLGAAGVYDGMKALGVVSAGTDEKGNPNPTDGLGFKAVAELGGAALAVVAAAHGGKNRALGIG